MDSVEAAITSAVPKPLRRRINPRQNTIVNVVWRALVLIVGLSLVALGLALLVLPGPGWGSILLGLVILASEYTWANRLVAPVRRRVRQEAQRVRAMPKRRQALLYVVTAVVSVGSIVIGVVVVMNGGISWPPW